MFLWRLSKHSLPTEYVRAHRKMSTTSTCGLCGAPDSWRHSLLDCTVSRCTWAIVDDEVGSTIIATDESRAKSWLFNLMESLSHGQFTLAAVTLWAIWTSRRKAIHEGIFQTPHAISAFITRYMRDLDVIRKPKRQVQAPSARNTVARPRAPPAGYVKIHVDAGTRM